MKLPDVSSGDSVRVHPHRGQSGAGRVTDLYANQYGVTRLHVDFPLDDSIILADGSRLSSVEVKRRESAEKIWIFDSDSGDPRARLDTINPVDE